MPPGPKTPPPPPKIRPPASNPGPARTADRRPHQARPAPSSWRKYLRRRRPGEAKCVIWLARARHLPEARGGIGRGLAAKARANFLVARICRWWPRGRVKRRSCLRSPGPPRPLALRFAGRCKGTPWPRVGAFSGRFPFWFLCIHGRCGSVVRGVSGALFGPPGGFVLRLSSSAWRRAMAGGALTLLRRLVTVEVSTPRP